jgi:sporulation protein YlmC with PRC-barrel domain
MKVNKLNGMKIITLDAYTLGEVTGAHFNPNTWEITDLDLKLSKEANEKLGFMKPKIEIGLKKPKLSGSIMLCLPVSYVKHVGNVVTLTDNLEVFKDLKECESE